MRPHFLAFRRTLPGGMIVLVSLEIDTEGVVHGILQVERRLDPARQRFATAPVVASASGRSKDDVLRQLRALAENDAELAVAIAAWERAHPSSRKPGERTDMDLSPVTLEGKVVRLEPLGLHHLDALCAVGLEPSLWALTTVQITTRDEMRDYMQQGLDEQAAGTALPFVTIERASGTVVGSTRFGSAVHAHRRVEIGWTWIAPRWQRTAINTEAKYLMLRHAFEVMGARRVELKTSSKNARSRAAMLRIGCTEEGTMRQHMINADGSNRDSVYFSIIDGEWPERKERLLSLLARAAATRP